MTRTITTILMVLVMSTTSYSQENTLRKNVVHLTGGTIVFYYAWGLNYERMLAGYDEKVINSLWIADGMTNTNFNKKSDFWDGSMAGGIGWRVQKPGGHFMFRMGLAWPETAYLGLGYSFGK